MQLRSFDYYNDTPTLGSGMTRIATLLRETRQQAEARGDVVLAFDNGDSLQGTPLEEGALQDLSGPHIFYRALDLMGYDAAGLGNHDFNFDLRHLVASLRDAPVPVLCSNARRVDGGQLPLRRWIVLSRELAGHAIRIGVFSVLPPQTLVWDADHLKGHMAIDDITASARDAIAALKSERCDIIIALAHTGLGERMEAPGQENALWPLSTLEGLDAIIAGHTHLYLPDPAAPKGSETSRGILNGTPVVMPGASGAHFGVIDLVLEKEAKGWTVVSQHVELRQVEAKEDASLIKMTACLHQKTRDHLAQTIGETPIPLHSFFGFLAPSPALALVAAAKAHALQRLVDLPQGVPVISSVAPAKMGGRGGPENYVDIPAGPLTLRHIFDLCFFPNRLAAVVVSGSQLRDWIEMASGFYNQLLPGAPDQALLDHTRPAHASDLFYGIQYEIDLSQPARFDVSGRLTHPEHKRLTSLTHQGRAVRSEDRFVVALSSYRANGGGNVTALQQAERLDVPHVLVRDALKDYVQQGLFPSCPHDACFRFRSLGQTEALAQTGPGAVAYLDELADICVGRGAVDSQGFLQVPIRL